MSFPLAPARLAICVAALCTCSMQLHAQGVVDTTGVLAVVPVAATAGAGRANQDRDSTPPWITRRELAGLGLSLVATLAVSPLDHPVANEFQESRWKSNGNLQDVSTSLAFLGGPGPFLVAGGMFALGELSRSPGLASAGEHVTESVLLAASLTALGKGIAGRALPGVQTSENFAWARGFHKGNGPFVSFPSGHTAAAFALAASLTGEAGAWRPGLDRYVGPAAYTVASAIAVARVYQRVHWMSDLPLAAAIGIWSGLSVESHVHRQRGGKVRHLLESASVERTSDGATMVGLALPFAPGGN